MEEGYDDPDWIADATWGSMANEYGYDCTFGDTTELPADGSATVPSDCLRNVTGREADGDMGAPPYLYAGPACYVSHEGDRPLRILWRLDQELPADVFRAARVTTG